MDPLHEERDLQDAIRAASEHLGVDPERAAEEAVVIVRPGLDVPLLSRSLLVGLALTVLVVVASFILVDAPPSSPSAQRMEEDLRWSVAQVVTEVERLRATLGRLPEASELHAVLSEAVTYRRTEDSYVVVGARSGVDVEYDGRLPLERWQTLELYGDAR